MTSDKNDDDDLTASKSPVTVVSTPTGRIPTSPEWQHLTFGNTPDLVIIDEVTPPGEFKWPEKFPEIVEADYAEIERRFMGLYPGAVELTQALHQLGQTAKVTADELRSSLSKYTIPPELLMTKHERQHANHPTEKNPNHPRFQKQPTRSRRRK